MQELDLDQCDYLKICIMSTEESPQAWSKCPPSEEGVQKKAIIISTKIIFNQNKMPHLQF